MPRAIQLAAARGAQDLPEVTVTSPGGLQGSLLRGRQKVLLTLRLSLPPGQLRLAGTHPRVQSRPEVVLGGTLARRLACFHGALLLWNLVGGYFLHVAAAGKVQFSF